MAFSAVPYALQNASHSAALFRQALSAVVPNTGGLVQIGDLPVTQLATPAMQVQVGVGRCFIPGTNTGNVAGAAWSTQGMYFGLNDAPVNLPIATADATNPRIDIVVATVNDAFYSGTQNSGALQVITGTPAATPAAPAVPANSIQLAQVAVAANATSIINANITTTANSTLDAMSKGLVTETDYTTLSGGSTSLAVICNIASFTFKANRWYEVFSHGSMQNNTANTVSLAHIHTDSTANSAANTTGLTELMGYNVPTTVANQAYRFHLSRKIKYTADTTLQLKLTAEPQVGGGTVKVAGGSTWPVQLGVIDLGAQF